LYVIPAQAGIALAFAFLVEESKAFRAVARVTFFACAKKVTKETHPCLRALRAARCGFAEPAGIFGRHILVPSKNVAHPCTPPLAGFTRRLRRCGRGANSEKQRRDFVGFAKIREEISA
jgi:hypothetical protein